MNQTWEQVDPGGNWVLMGPLVGSLSSTRRSGLAPESSTPSCSHVSLCLTLSIIKVYCFEREECIYSDQSFSPTPCRHQRVSIQRRAERLLSFFKICINLCWELGHSPACGGGRTAGPGFCSGSDQEQLSAATDSEWCPPPPPLDRHQLHKVSPADSVRIIPPRAKQKGGEN